MRVALSRDAVQELEELPPAIHLRALWVLERLTEWPRVSGAKPLSGPLAGHYRIRTGDYRLQFRLEGATVIVEKIGHRDRFYED